MDNIKTFKIEEKFNGIDNLYEYLKEHVDVISKLTEIKIQKPLKEKLFSLTGKEFITERNIIFVACKKEFPENFGELIVLASIYQADIIVFLLSDVNKTYIEILNWLQGICNDDTQFMFGEVEF